MQDYARFYQDLHKIFSQGPVQDHARASYEGLYQDPTRSSHKDLCKIMPGPVQDHARTFSWTSPRSPQMFSQGKPSCASLCLRGRHALGHVRAAILRENFQVKGRRPRPEQPICASLRSQNAHGHYACRKNHLG